MQENQEGGDARTSSLRPTANLRRRRPPALRNLDLLRPAERDLAVELAFRLATALNKHWGRKAAWVAEVWPEGAGFAHGARNGTLHVVRAGVGDCIAAGPLTNGQVFRNSDPGLAARGRLAVLRQDPGMDVEIADVIRPA